MTESALHRNNVRVRGNGDRTVVLAHGFGTDQTAWASQEDVLSRDHRVVLFDHVGAGGSDISAYSPHRYRSLHSFAADVIDLLDAVAPAQPVDYVGHSMSGMIGLLAAIAEPTRFRSLTLLAASPRYINDDHYKGGFDEADVNALFDAMASNYHAWVSGFARVAASDPDRPDVAERFASTLSALRPDLALAMARLIFRSDHRADLPKLAVPTLVLQSKDDIAVPVEVGEYLARHIPRATMIQLDARGHLPHMSVPDEVNEAILSFFR